MRLTYALTVEMREELASGAAGGLDQETGKHACSDGDNSEAECNSRHLKMY